MDRPAPTRRLSMSSDAQWTSKGRAVPSSGYALSPASTSNELSDPTTPASPGGVTSGSSPGSPGSIGSTRTTRQLNASSIFARLGLADSSLVASRPEPSSSSTPSSNVRSDSAGMPSFEGLRVADDVTPTVNGGKEASCYMDASNSDNHLGYTTPSTDHGIQSPPTRMMSIEADILLPFADRPSEVKELLENTEQNRGLYELLKETFTVRSANNTSTNLLVASPPSSPSVSPSPMPEQPASEPPKEPEAKTLNLLRSQEHKRQDSASTVTPTTPTGDFSLASSQSQSSKKWTFDTLQSHLQIPRSVLCDQDWIDILKANVYPRSLLLWERLRACLGVDVDDEQGGDRYEPLSSDIEPTSLLSESIAQQGGAGGGAGLTRSFSSNGSIDLLLSPRAILSRMSSSNSNSNENVNPPSSALSSVFSSSLESSLPSPSGFSSNNLNPFSSPHKPGPASSLPLNIPNSAAAAQASPSRSPIFGLKDLENSPSSVSRSPGPSSTSMSAARNHRRSSSGGSSFRKSFAMSSINEDTPLDNFESRDPPLSSAASGGSKTPENELQVQAQQQVSVNDTVRNDGKVDLGSLLRLKGFGVGDIPPSSQSPQPVTPSSSIPAFTPPLSSAPSSSYGATNAAAPGHLPPSTPLSPTMSTSYSSSSLSGAAAVGAGGSNPRSPSFSASSAFAQPQTSSALGRKLANPTTFLSSNTSSANNSPTKSMNNAAYNKYRDSRRDSYDEYISVFGGSEEERSSVSGASVQSRSRGQGPHMRFSFGSQDATTPALNGPRGGSGFALAGLQNRNSSTSSKNPASARVVAVDDTGSGKSTPKAR